ncbi:MAG TPA: magnesium transporter [Planctomycetaceae bacterium]|nr:magnesium transporter [Planctomycetaceae bacterium]
MYHSLLKPDLREMLTEQDVRGMAEFCDVLHPAVTAEVLEGFEIAELLQVLDSCPLRKQVVILEYLPLAVQVSIVESLDQTDRKRLSRLLEEMSSDDRVDLLSELSETQVERLLPLIAQAERNDIRKLLSFPEESAGSVMTTEYASLPESVLVREAIERLRKQAPNRETIYYIYVIDEKRQLLGLVSLRDIILASPDALVSDIMTRDVISVRVDDDQEDVASLLQKFNFIAIPVVDEQNRLVGIVTHDDAMDILEEEATEDAHLAGAVAPLEESYLETSLLTIFRKRGGWLAVLSITAVLIAAILQRLQYISDLYVWMIGFMPLVLSAGGNAGSQSATLVIRMLAVEDSTRHVAVRIAYRELIMGVMLGCFLATIGLAFAWWFVDLRVGIVIALTMTLVVVNGTVWGAMLPLLFRKMGMDPAMMSNPLIAAISDMMGVLIYFAVALSMLGGTS